MAAPLKVRRRAPMTTGVDRVDVLLLVLAAVALGLVASCSLELGAVLSG